MVGELRCLNCARHLADVVDGEHGQPRLSAPAGLAEAPILVTHTARGMRCSRCGGRPMLERSLEGERAPRGARPSRLSPAA